MVREDNDNPLRLCLKIGLLEAVRKECASSRVTAHSRVQQIDPPRRRGVLFCDYQKHYVVGSDTCTSGNIPPPDKDVKDELHCTYPFLGWCSASLLTQERQNDALMKSTHRGARTHDHKVKSLALYRLS